MAGYNSPFGSSSSTSSLLRSAASAQASIQAYEDQIAADQWDNSIKTYDDFLSYASYLESRASNSSDPSTQLSYQKKIDSAQKGFMSNEIQRQSTAIAEGQGTTAGKYNLVSNLYDQAVSAGLYDKAQELRLQADNLYIQAQNEAISAANAARTQSEKLAKANVASYKELVDGLESSLENFNNNYVRAGKKTAQRMLSEFAKEMNDKYDLGLEAGQQPNYFDIVSGVTRAINGQYHLAAEIAQTYDPSVAVDLKNKATETLTSINTIYGTMDYQQLQNFARFGAEQVSYNTAPDFQAQQGGAGGDVNPQMGYRAVPGGVEPLISLDSSYGLSEGTTNLAGDAEKRIKELGMNILDTYDNGTSFKVALGDKSPDWLKKILPANATTVVTANNLLSGGFGLQFEADSQTTDGKAVYSITKDNSGKNSLAETTNLGDKIVYQDENFNEADMAPKSVFEKVSSSPVGKAASAAYGAAGDMLQYGLRAANPVASGLLEAGKGLIGGLFGGQASAQSLTPTYKYKGPLFDISTQETQQTIKLPELKPLPKISTVQPKQAQPVAPKTVNPQQTASVQTGTAPKLQATATNIQGSKTGNISISSKPSSGSISF